MAVYTERSADEVAAFFWALGLGRPRSVRGITTGIENTNYFVDTEAREYVLTGSALMTTSPASKRCGAETPARW